MEKFLQKMDIEECTRSDFLVTTPSRTIEISALSTPNFDTGGNISPSSVLRSSNKKLQPFLSASWDDLSNHGRGVSKTMGITQEEPLIRELANLLSDSETETPITDFGRALRGENSSKTLLPIRLFDLSLETPSISRPSVDLPGTFSKLPVTKRALNNPSISSGSIFVAATQFTDETPINTHILATNSLDNRVCTTETSMIPARIPGLSLMKHSEGIYMLADEENKGRNTNVVASDNDPGISQNGDLFRSLCEYKTRQDIKVDDTSCSHCTIRAEIRFSGHDAIVLPPSEAEDAIRMSLSNPFLAKKLGTEQESFPLSLCRSERETLTHQKSELSIADCDAILLGENTSVRATRGTLTSPSSNIHYRKELDRGSDEITIQPETSPKPPNSSVQSSAKTLNTHTKSITTILIPDVKNSPTALLPPKKRTKSSRSSKNAAKKPSLRSLHCRNSNNLSPVVNAGTVFRENMIVWARWRPMYYCPAIIIKRMSTTRDLWKISFYHWKDIKRQVTLSADELVLCNNTIIPTINHIYFMRDRKQLIMDEVYIVNWITAEELLVRFSNNDLEIQVRLENLVIKKRSFVGLKRAQPFDFSKDQGLVKQPQLHSSQAEKTIQQCLVNSSLLISIGGGLTASAKRVVKEELSTQIKSLGGRIISPGDITTITNCSLITNGFFRTAKTFLALGLRMPIIECSWIRDCYAHGQLLDQAPYRIEIPEFISQCQVGELLAGWTFYLFGDGKFRISWRPVCLVNGAKVVERISLLDSNDGSEKRILAEELPSATSRLARQSKSMGIEIVTLDWLMKSILLGESST